MEGSGINRREFLKLLTVGTAVRALSPDAEISEPNLQPEIDEAIRQTELETSIINLKLALEEKYKLRLEIDKDEIILATSDKNYPGMGELSPAKKLEALELLAKTLAEYPTFVISQSGLHSISILTRPRQGSANETVQGFSYMGHLEAAAQEHQTGIVVTYDWNEDSDVPNRYRISQPARQTELDMKDWTKGSTPEQFITVIHHELSHHFIDVESTESTPRIQEFRFTEKWENLFKAHNLLVRSKYIDKTRIFDQTGKVIGHDYSLVKPPGFAHGYGMFDSGEDRATLAALLMTQRGLSSEVIAGDDEQLLNKIKNLKAFYLSLSYGLMDEDYWSKETNYSKGEPSDTLGEAELQQYFLAKANVIVKTPYTESPHKNKVTEATYSEWQTKLANIYNIK